MERTTRVSVFESDKPAEIQLIKSKLDEAEITSDTENNYLTFTTTPTATTLKVMVDLQDEKKAFEVIDAYMQQSQNQ
ncbi:hypothetical protein ASG31_04830 [Chryseobacterium sp. Leaf404]|uniref:DUF2007 domain-containing protein n=1 Tax=unclassified Chryseobacterium TaxID=2593645 RepID=UPI0007019962|nr:MULTISPECIES: DUF2007 domain-containing protein [unclassified Chryseobacterium]KQT18063.1 hypothetical protein ASG31_04830 [Chryseobacterium sp. Leaf404]